MMERNVEYFMASILHESTWMGKEVPAPTDIKTGGHDTAAR